MRTRLPTSFIDPPRYVEKINCEPRILNLETNASVVPAGPPLVDWIGRIVGEIVGKLLEAVEPVTYVLPLASTAMP